MTRAKVESLCCLGTGSARIGGIAWKYWGAYVELRRLAASKIPSYNSTLPVSVSNTSLVEVTYNGSLLFV